MFGSTTLLFRESVRSPSKGSPLVPLAKAKESTATPTTPSSSSPKKRVLQTYAVKPERDAVNSNMIKTNEKWWVQAGKVPVPTVSMVNTFKV